MNLELTDEGGVITVAAIAQNTAEFSLRTIWQPTQTQKPEALSRAVV